MCGSLGIKWVGVGSDNSSSAAGINYHGDCMNEVARVFRTAILPYRMLHAGEGR